jgi:hypothetical protein
MDISLISKYAGLDEEMVMQRERWKQVLRVARSI